MITPEQLKAVFPKCREPGNWIRTFTQVLGEFEITDGNRLNMWLAQCGHESAHFNVLRENLSYSAVQLAKVWPKRFPTVQIAAQYERQPEKLGNFVYANRMGNGDPDTQDGYRYRGGGLIQLTGRENYREVGEAMGLDLELRPNQIEQQSIAARTAGYFWKHHDLNDAADADDIDGCTKFINGGMTGADERRGYYEKLKAL